MSRLIFALTVLFCSTIESARLPRDATLVLKPNCRITTSGCECNVKEGIEETTREYTDVSQCKKSIELQTVENKAALAAEIKQKFGAFKENCFPKPSGGCKCNVDEGQGETVREFSEDKDCKVSVEAETAQHKKELNEEIKEKFGDFKENCFPKPSGGCKCTSKNEAGDEVVTAHDDPEQCKTRTKRDVAIQRQPSDVGPKSPIRSKSPSPASQDVRDPVREKAQANYRAVVNELNEKFAGLKEGCFPRPKGCLCVVGKDASGRDITERRMLDKDCKCQAGEKGPGCPAA